MGDSLFVAIVNEKQSQSGETEGEGIVGSGRASSADGEKFRNLRFFWWWVGGCDWVVGYEIKYMNCDVGMHFPYWRDYHRSKKAREGR